jgi:5-methylcytosine-specific restriction endonuclease McrA
VDCGAQAQPVGVESYDGGGTILSPDAGWDGDFCRDRKTILRRLAAKQQKALLWVLQDGICPVCQKEMQEWEAHHLVPWSKGGPTTTENLKLLCPKCHKTEHSRREKDSKI